MNKKNLFWVVVFFVALGLGLYALTRTTTSSGTDQNNKTGGVGVECYGSTKYFVIQKSLAPSVGSDILVKYKTSTGDSFNCVYTVASGDFEIKNVEAEYFLTLTDNFLVLDQGTAPEPRGLVVYDLGSHKIAFTDSYAKPVVVTGDSITYLSKTAHKPTLQNCPKLNEYVSNGLGAIVMSKVTVDLNTLVKSDLGTSECRATQ